MSNELARRKAESQNEIKLFEYLINQPLIIIIIKVNKIWANKIKKNNYVSLSNILLLDFPEKASIKK